MLLIQTGCSPVNSVAADPSKSAPAGIEVTDMGPGLLSFQINGSHIVGDTHFVISRRMIPAAIVGYNLHSRQITFNEEIVLANGRRTSGGRAVTSIGDDLYIAMPTEEGNASLVRLNTQSGEIHEIGEIPARVVWDITASPDGVLYLATSRQSLARVFEYNPQSNAWKDLGSFETNPRQDARSIAATKEKVYVGIGYNAIDLWAVDRKSAQRESILPPELRDVFWLYTLDANEKWIAAGTNGPNARLAVIDRSDYSNYRIVEYGQDMTIQELTLVDDEVYFGHGGGVWRYDIANDSLDHLNALPVNRGIFHRNGRIHGAAGSERIGWFDLETNQRERVNLLSLGAEVGAEPAQSLGAGGGKAYFGGRSLGIRDIESGELGVISSPGEAKSMVVVDGILYMGMYTSGRLVSYDPTTGNMETLAQAPEGQLRPRVVHYDDTHRIFLMGTQADELGGGALTVYHRDTGETFSFVNPLGERAIATIASGHGVVYLSAQRPDGALAAWDPASREWLWEVSPPSDEWFMGLAVSGNNLFAFTDRGTLVVIDPATRKVLHLEKLFSSGGRLLAYDGEVYGVTNDAFFKIDRDSWKPKILLGDLNSRWFPGWPSLAVDENGSFYVIRGTNVVKIDLVD